jgi:hypothetical protein
VESKAWIGGVDVLHFGSVQVDWSSEEEFLAVLLEFGASRAVLPQPLIKDRFAAGIQIRPHVLLNILVGLKEETRFFHEAVILRKSQGQFSLSRPLRGDGSFVAMVELSRFAAG